MMIRRSLLAALFLLTATVSQASATTWLVPGDGSNTCTVPSPNCDTIDQAVTASSTGDTIQIAAGSFPVATTQILTKTLTFVGAGQANTTVTVTAGIAGFSVRTDDIVFRDFTIQGGLTGVSFQSVASNNTLIERVTFSAQTARGIEISVPVSNVAVADSTIATPGVIGVRMASTTQVNGLSITGTAFIGNSYGIYQANDGNTSTLANLLVDGCTFTNVVNYAIYAEEMRDSSIEDSTFTGGASGIGLLKFYASSGFAMSNIGIRRNQFSGFTANALDLEMIGMGLGTPGLTIEGNTVTKNVAIQTSAAATFVRLHPSQPNGQVDFIDNTITATGIFGAGTASHGVQLRGNGPVSFTGNVIDGGNVGGSATTPASSGIFIQSRSGSTIMPATTVISGSCNRISGYHNGVSVFDSFAGSYGGLTAGASVSFQNNVIAGNDQAGAANGATPVLDFENDWWGCVDGPGNPGCDAIVGGIDADPAAVAPPACVECQVDAQCSDGLFCNGAETCNIGTNTCEPGPSTCGDGTTQGACGELCDDGNPTSGDGCSSTCQPEFVCTPTPLVGCRTSAPAKSQLALKNKTPDTKDQSQWKWSKGAITPKADFGTPLTSTDYQFCLYAGGVLVSRAYIPAGGNCAGKPCWKENAKGFQYKDKEATPEGITDLKLKEGLIAGKAQIQLKGKGVNIDMPSMPLAQPVRVQLRNSTGVCWETTHSAPASKNDSAQFKDKND